MRAFAFVVVLAFSSAFADEIPIAARPACAPSAALAARSDGDIPAAPPSEPESPSAAPTGLTLLIERFQLFGSGGRESVSGTLAPSRQRMLHLVGDPDALVTLGDLAGTGDVRLKAAVELNDVVLHALAPDERVRSDDTRQRAAGDYRALDASGRPYQFRLGARLVW